MERWGTNQTSAMHENSQLREGSGVFAFRLFLLALAIPPLLGGLQTLLRLLIPPIPGSTSTGEWEAVISVIVHVVFGVTCIWYAVKRRGTGCVIGVAAVRMGWDLISLGIYFVPLLQMLPSRSQHSEELLGSFMQMLLTFISIPVLPIMVIIALRRPAVRQMFER